MSLTPIPIIQRPVRERFPNRYTGGYDCSTVTDKLRWQTIRSVKNVTLTTNSNAGGETVVGRKVYPCYCPPTIVPPNPCDSSVAAAFQSINATPFYSCSDPSGRCVVVGSWGTDPLIIKDGSGTSVGFLSGIGSGSSGFISVFDASGTCNWSAKLVGTNVTPYSVIADLSGNITCSGFYRNSLSTGSFTAYSASGLQTLTPTNNGFNNIFIVQYSPTGALNWCANIVSQTSGINDYFPLDLVVGANNSLYICCRLSYSSQFYNSDNTAGGSFISVGSTGWGSVFGISNTGFYQWNANITSFGSSPCTLYYTGSAILLTAYVFGNSLTITDQLGNTLSVTYTSGVLTQTTVVAQLSLNGVPQWATVAASSYDNTPGTVVILPTTRVKSVVQGGYYIGSIGTGGGNVINFYDTNSTSVISLPMSSNPVNGGSFLASVSSSGYTAWAAQILGYKVQLYGLVATTGGLCVTGISFSDSLSNPVGFYNAGSTGAPALTLPTASSFVAKYSLTGQVVWARRISPVYQGRTFTPLSDLSGNIYIFFTASGTFNFYNAGGAVVKTLILGLVNQQVLAKYSGGGTFLWATRVGGSVNSLSVWPVLGTCGDVFTVGSANISDTHCNVYDISGNVLFSFPDSAENNAITTHWV